jgi:hypothetical protein
MNPYDAVNANQTTNSVSNSLLGLWNQFVTAIPNIVGAIVILIVGWIIGSIVGAIVRRVTRFLDSNQMVRKSATMSRMENTRFSLSNILGKVVKWFIFIAFLIPAADILRLPAISNFLDQIVLYIPNVIAAAVILVIGFILADFLKNTAAGFLGSSRLAEEHRLLIGNVIKYAVVVFTFMAALIELRIVPELIEILFGGLVLALALSFGLGGREHASDLIRNMRMKGGEKL